MKMIHLDMAYNYLQRIKKHHTRPGMQKTKNSLLSREKHKMEKQYLQCVFGRIHILVNMFL